MNNFSIPKTTYALVPEGTYLAEIVELEQAEGAFGAQVKFLFQLLDAEEDAFLVGWASAKYSDKSKLFKWTKAALGANFDPSADFQAATLEGRRVMLNVSRGVNGNGEYNKVEDILPPPRQSQAQQQNFAELPETDAPNHYDF